ncbi:MAG: kelch repeat-containing protein [Planctomycetota bacterium]
MHHPLIVVSLLATAVSAQVDLQMDAGSFPGTLSGRLGPYQQGFPAAVIFSGNSGPTPLSLIDSRDLRQLNVGLESLPLAFVGVFAASGYFDLPALPIGNQAWLLDRALYFQAVTLEGSAVNFLIGEVSEPRVVRFAPAGNFRYRGNQMTQARAFFDRAIPIAGGRWMIAAGGSGALLSQAALSSTEIYDPLGDTFFAGPNLNFARSVHTATRLQDGKWLLVAGVDTLNDPQDTAEVLDPQTQFARVVANPMLARRMGHSANLLANGRVLVAGGLSDLNGTGFDPVNSALASTEFYDPTNDSWIAGPSMSRPRAGHVAIPLPDGRILFAGGVGYTTIIIRIPQIWNQTEIYDPNTGSFSSGPSMRTARAIFSVADLGGGRFLVAGGMSSLLAAGAPTDEAEIFDANTGAWSAVGRMGTARGMSATVPLGGGRFLLAGGTNGTLTSPSALASTEVFDVATGVFTPGPNMTSSRVAFGAFASPAGPYHLIGGGTGGTGTSTTTAEWYYR